MKEISQKIQYVLNTSHVTDMFKDIKIFKGEI